MLRLCAVVISLVVLAGIAKAQLAIDEKLSPLGGAASLTWVDLDADTLVATQGNQKLLVYERTFVGWQISQEIAPPAGLYDSTIFRGIISGHTIAAVVGSAPDPVTGIPQTATAFYSNLGGTWVHVDTLPDYRALELVGDEMFATDGGDMHFFRRTGGVWTLVSSVPPPVTPNGGYEILSFRGDTAVARTDIDPDNIADDTIALHEVRRTGDTWTINGLFQVPEGNPSGGFLGPSSVGDNYLALGAPFTDGNGPNVALGAVYVFRRNPTNAWEYLQTLQPRDLDPNDQFGRQVAIDGDTLVVSAFSDDDAADGAGAVYVFDRAGDEFVQTDKLIPTDAAPFDAFGRLLAISGKRVAALSNNPPLGAVYTYGCGPDSDGDGLCDDWETTGIPYLDSSGAIQRYLLDIDGDGISDADPTVLDLFVELDVMSANAASPNLTFGIDEEALLAEAFFDAPLVSPLGPIGISLHLDVQQDVFPFNDVEFSEDGWPENEVALGRRAFGTFEEQSADDAEALLNAKAKAFRYGVALNDVAIIPEDFKAIGGNAELPGDDFVIYLKTMGTAEDRAGVFMHELGHTLGLGHGGGDHINGKPNYPSIMNYSVSYRMTWNAAFWELSYSREALAILDETNLSEDVPIGIGASGYYDAWSMPYSSVVANNAPCFPEINWGLQYVTYASLSSLGSGIDYNTDCDSDDLGVIMDLNYLSAGFLPSEDDSPSPDQILVGYNDWENIRFAVADGGGAFNGALPPDGEPSNDLIDFVRATFEPPTPACPPDLNDDGILDNGDISTFVSLFLAGDTAADINGDEFLDNGDIGAFVNAFLAGC